MKFEDIQTDTEGLKRLVDYLKSNNNSYTVGTEYPEKLEIFFLNQASHISQAGNSPSDRYSITVSSLAKPTRKKFRELSELLIEIYKH